MRRKRYEERERGVRERVIEGVWRVEWRLVRVEESELGVGCDRKEKGGRKRQVVREVREGDRKERGRARGTTPGR